MFSCNACFRRFVKAAISTDDSHYATLKSGAARSASGLLPRSLLYPVRKQRSSAAAASTYEPSKPRYNPDIRNGWGDSLRGNRDGRRQNVQLAVKGRGGQNGATSAEQEEETKLRQKRKNLQLEMDWLQDPMRLSEHVKKLLDRNDDIEKAFALVRMTNRSNKYTVSWNHILDWQMKQGKTKAALQTYNEMKKRAQRPDSYTYILLLRGLAANPHYPNSLGRALSLYHSMYAPNSQVYPTIIHTNAVLHVCAKAHDKESVWDIASRMPKNGPHSADNLTYSILLNTLREDAIGMVGPVGPVVEPARAKKEEAIREGRTLWATVMQRWRHAELALDEGLVVAMGRLLLIGRRPKDWDDIFSLINQSMNIPRLTKRLGTPAEPSPGWGSAQNLLGDSPAAESTKPVFKPGAEFNAFTPAQFKPPEKGKTTHIEKSLMHAPAKPSNQTLSLLMEACILLPGKSTAHDYWGLLTDPNGWAIKPDAASLHAYLRVLRVRRSSQMALEVVRDEMAQFHISPQPKTFIIAMSTCARDPRNEEAVEAGTELLRLMAKRLPKPEMKVVKAFVMLATRVDDLKKKLEALSVLAPVVRDLLAWNATADEVLPQVAEEAEEHEEEIIGLHAHRDPQGINTPDLVEVAKRIIGLYHQVLHPEQKPDGSANYASLSQLLNKEQIEDLASKQQRLNTFVTANRRKNASAENRGTDNIFRDKLENERNGATDERREGPETGRQRYFDSRREESSDSPRRSDRGPNPGKRERAEMRERKAIRANVPW